jgi:hypothetical protein
MSVRRRRGNFELAREQEAAKRKETLEERRHQELLEQNRMQHEERMAAMGARRTFAPAIAPRLSTSSQAGQDTVPSPSFSVGATVRGKGWSGEIKRLENGKYLVSITSSLDEQYKVGQEVLFSKDEMETDK